MRDLANLLCILFDSPITKAGITFMLKQLLSEKKAKEAPSSEF